MSKKKMIKKIVLSCVALALVLLAVYSGLQILESTVLPGKWMPEETAPSKTIVRDGVNYFPRQDITVLMVLGIDRFGPVQDSGSYRNDGAADMVTLLIFDEQRKVLDVMHLNRDTMLEMPVLGVMGKEAGTYYGQLALSHTYGSGQSDSAVNVKNTLERFLPGLSVDYYISMNMDAISIFNDAVGGVSVTVVDDFSGVDPTITKGTITLRGEQAIHYVQSRKDVGDQMNVSRMERQKQYMEGFLNKLSQKGSKDAGFFVSVYDEISPYFVTDCSLNTISSMLERYSDYELGEMITLEGENILGVESYEFYVDEEALDALVLKHFYAPKQ